MFPIQISIRELGMSAQRLRADLFSYARTFGDMREPLTRSVHEVVIPSIGMNFVVGGRPQWQALSLNRVARRGSATPILIDKGQLIKAALSKTSWRITNDTADMSPLDNKVPYAKYHQTGTDVMPRREFAILQPRDIDDIVGIFSEWVGEQARRRGL